MRFQSKDIVCYITDSCSWGRIKLPDGIIGATIPIGEREAYITEPCILPRFKSHVCPYFQLFRNFYVKIWIGLAGTNIKGVAVT